ncbi:hypothetical protein [Halorientalis regularis]|uniref:Uncharacterized protein n=1 Tax=Halorientalis regularis TaxID=660518 RepID=A0A1G7QPB6_9EURY|nr:hypothetical protein [Halorientalis regularis]SDF99709.1 hypothetical protein SAMN05216218_11314 [Halorientalis regularis]
MSQQVDQAADTQETVYEEYIMGVRVVELTDGDDTRYRFDAPDHCGETFDDSEVATLYAAVYFDVNGFVEADTGERGVPPAIVSAGRDTMAAYMRTLPGADTEWLSCYFAERPEKIRRLLRNVRARAEKIQRKAVEHGIEDDPDESQAEG